MVCRSFSISTRWPNVINIQGWFLPDHGYFITDDKLCSGKAEGEGLEEGGSGEEGCLEGEHSHYKGQRRAVMLFASTSNPPSLSLSLSAFCFSCQENWQAVGMKKADQVEQAPDSEAMLGHWKRKVKVLPLDKTSGEKKAAQTDGLFLDQPLHLWIFYTSTKCCQFSSTGISIWAVKTI